MRYLIAIAIHLSALLVPFSESQNQVPKANQPFQDWPTEFQGVPLSRLPMTEKEQGFSQDFPGEIGRFTDGSREIIIRFVERASRKLHPTADCLRGSGYTVEPQPLSRDKNHQL